MSSVIITALSRDPMAVLELLAILVTIGYLTRLMLNPPHRSAVRYRGVCPSAGYTAMEDSFTEHSILSLWEPAYYHASRDRRKKDLTPRFLSEVGQMISMEKSSLRRQRSPRCAFLSL